jgi:hypothetical protein
VLCTCAAHDSLKDVFIEARFRGTAQCLVLGWPLSIRTGSSSDNLGQPHNHKTGMGRS